MPNMLVQRVSPSANVVTGRIYVTDFKFSDSKDGKWDDVRLKIDLGRECSCYCNGVFIWYDTKVGKNWI